jgi:Icc-related predicted phosphoesterase
MNILFTCDLHGRRYLYQQLVEVVRRHQPDLVLLGGDLCADCLRRDPLGEQVHFVQSAFAAAMQRMRTGNPHLPIGFVPGNHDLACATTAMTALSGASRVQLLTPGNVWRLGSLAISGYACAPPSGWWAWNYERLDRRGDPLPGDRGAVWDEEIGELVDRTAAEHFTRMPTMEEELRAAVTPDGAWMFVAHCPPYDSGLDRVRQGQAVGSHAVRDFISRAQPTVSLHGHCHDSPDVSGQVRCMIGRTLAVNPGQRDDHLIYVCFDSESPAETLAVLEETW